MNEIVYSGEWKPVAEPWGDLYEVSRSGQVRRYGGQPLAVCVNKRTKYPMVSFWRGYNHADPSKRVMQTFTVHRLVAIAWIANPKKLRCVDHINGDRGDYRIENLEWVTHKENMRRAIAAGRFDGAAKARGELSGQAKLKIADVLEIKRRWAAGGVTKSQLGRDYKITHVSILNIVSGRTWREVALS